LQTLGPRNKGKTIRKDAALTATDFVASGLIDFGEATSEVSH